MMTDKQAADIQAVQDAIDDMPDDDKKVAKKLHEIITKNAPDWSPRTWYGMPAYSNQQGKVICFFRSRKKFGERFMTLGFNDVAKLDDGNMWPLYYAIEKFTKAEEDKVAELIEKAAR